MDEQIGALSHFMLAQVGHYELLAAKFVRPFHAGGQDGMRLGGVAANDDDEAGIFYVLDGTGIATVTHRAEQAHRGRGLAITGTIVHIVRADDGAGQLLHEIAFLVRAFGRGDESERVGPAAGLDFRQPARNQAERFIPACFAKLAAFANERFG